MASLTDISLVAQVAVLGNRRAFDELVRRYQSPVRRFFLHQTLGDETLSDDLAQDTFLKAYTSIGTFRGLSSFQTWLMRIAYNVFYDHCRKMRNEKIEMRNVNEEMRNGIADTHSSSLISHSSFRTFRMVSTTVCVCSLRPRVMRRQDSSPLSPMNLIL